MEAKKNLKASFRYANSRMKTKVRISEYGEDGGGITHSDTEKAEVRKKFFISVFIEENTQIFINLTKMYAKLPRINRHH